MQRDLLSLLADASTAQGRIRFLPDDPEPRTVASLWETAQRIGATLSASSEGVVAGVLSNSFAAVTALIGAWCAGLTFVSLPLPGRGADIAEYQAFVISVLADTGADLLLFDPDQPGTGDGGGDRARRA